MRTQAQNLNSGGMSRNRQPPETALHFGRTNKVARNNRPRLAAVIAQEVIDSLPKPVRINADS